VIARRIPSPEGAASAPYDGRNAESAVVTLPGAVRFPHRGVITRTTREIPNE